MSNTHGGRKCEHSLSFCNLLLDIGATENTQGQAIAESCCWCTTANAGTERDNVDCRSLQSSRGYSDGNPREAKRLASTALLGIDVTGAASCEQSDGCA